MIRTPVDAIGGAVVRVLSDPATGLRIGPGDPSDPLGLADCELLRADRIAQPVNTFSSAVLALIGLWLIVRARRTTGGRRAAAAYGLVTLLAGLGLYDFCHGAGKRIHVLANKVEQAQILIDTARTMAKRLEELEVKVLMDHIRRDDADCEMSALTSKAPMPLDAEPGAAKRHVPAAKLPSIP